MQRTHRLTMALVAAILATPAFAANQTDTLSPVGIHTNLGFTATVASPLFAGALPAMQSFATGTYNGQWVFVGGMTAGMHDFDDGFFPQAQNKEIVVIDPGSGQVWSRSIEETSSGLTPAQIETLALTNAQYTQKGDRLYIAGGYGTYNGTTNYKTFDTLTALDLPALTTWVKSGTGSVTGAMRQISDELFHVTGGEMRTTSNGRSHLVFGMDYPGNYSFRLEGNYTFQVRSFDIVDNGTTLAAANVTYGPTNPDFRRRDLNVVPVIQKEAGQLVEKNVALAGVFTPDVGAWTVPVTIDSAGHATEADPLAAGTFKQGMNSYRSGNLGMYSAKKDEMHTLLFGGISFEYWDPVTQSLQIDYNLPFSSDITDIVRDSQGNMAQHLMNAQFPVVKDFLDRTMLLGAESDFFLAPGVATYGNGVIDLDALAPGIPHLVGYLYGGIASPLPNGGKSMASNNLFPIYITPEPVPEAGTLGLLGAGVLALAARRKGTR